MCLHACHFASLAITFPLSIEAKIRTDKCTRVYTQEFTYRFSPSKMQEVLLSNLSDLTVSFLRDTWPSTEKVQYLIGLLDSIDGNLISIPQIWAAMPGHRRKRPGPNTLKGMVCACAYSTYVPVLTFYAYMQCRMHLCVHAYAHTAGGLVYFCVTSLSRTAAQHTLAHTNVQVPVLQLRTAQVLRYREIARNQRLAQKKHQAELRRNALKRKNLLEDTPTEPDVHSDDTGDHKGNAQTHGGGRGEEKPKAAPPGTAKGPESWLLKRTIAMTKDAAVSRMRPEEVFRGMRKWGWGWGVVWDVGGVVGPLLYHMHVPCRIAAADALEGGCIAMMQKLIRHESKANLQSQANDSDDEEDQHDPAYQTRVIAAVEDALRQVVVRWRQELTGQWLVRCHNLILRVEPEKHSDARPGRIFVHFNMHSEALGHPSSRAHHHHHSHPTTSLPQQRTAFLWCSATERKSEEVEQHEDPGGVGGEGLRDVGAGGLGVGLSEGVAKDREGMYRQLQLLVPHVSSLGWLNRMLRQVYM